MQLRPTNPPRNARASITQIPWIRHECLGAARRGCDDIAVMVIRFSGFGEGSPCHDFGGALRVTAGQSSEGPRAVGSATSLRRPDLDGPAARATIAPTSRQGAPS